jgi:hypothetical protein
MATTKCKHLGKGDVAGWWSCRWASANEKVIPPWLSKSREEVWINRDDCRKCSCKETK